MFYTAVIFTAVNKKYYSCGLCINVGTAQRTTDMGLGSYGGQRASDRAMSETLWVASALIRAALAICLPFATATGGASAAASPVAAEAAFVAPVTTPLVCLILVVLVVVVLRACRGTEPFLA